MDSKAKESYFITPTAQRRFKVWLIDNNLNINSFAKKIGVSRQYIERVIKGQISITPKVREWFKKGGYELL